MAGVVTTVFTALLMLRTRKETFIGIGRLFNMYWDYLGFITNSILFFLIGIPVFSLFLLQSGALWFLIIIAPFVIVMISRTIVIYGGSIVLRTRRHMYTIYRMYPSHKVNGLRLTLRAPKQTSRYFKAMMCALLSPVIVI